MSGFNAGVINYSNTPAIGAGALASRPASGPAGLVFLDTTTPEIFRWNGATWQSFTPSTSGFVQTTRTLTIGGVTFDLSANRTWTNLFSQSGNAFGAAAVLGTTDSNLLRFIVSGTTRYEISTAGIHSITGRATVTATSAVNLTALTLIGSGAAGTITSSINFRNSNGAGNNVFIGIQDNSERLIFNCATNTKMVISTEFMQCNNFIAVGSVQTVVDLGGAIGNTAGNSVGLSFGLTASQSQGGYDAIFSNVIDNETFTAGNRNLLRLAFNSSSKFTLTKVGNLTIAGTFTTVQPSASGAGAYKFGKVLAGAVAMDAANYVEVEIDGVIVKLLKAA